MIKSRLMAPGPVELSPATLLHQALPMVHHRSAGFRETYQATVAGLRRLVGLAAGELLLIPGSGTAGMEAAVVNLFSPGDKVLAVCNGYFGERFAGIGRAYGLVVETLDVPWGQAVAPAAIDERLAADAAIKGVLVIFHDTSTGVVNDLQAIGEVVSQRGALLVVDGVSGIAVSPLLMDAWHIDCLVGASQKGLCAPPGVALVGLSDRAWAVCEASRTPRFYFDLRKLEAMLRSSGSLSPWTPPIATIRALRHSVEEMLATGLDAVFAHQRQVAHAVQAGLEAMGLELLVAPSERSQGVTVALAPQGIAPPEIVRRMEADWGVTLAGSLGPLRDRSFRVGHMGSIDILDVVSTCFALEVVLGQLGAHVEPGASARAIHALVAAETTM